LSIPLNEVIDFIDDAEVLSKAKLERMGIEIIHKWG